MKVQLLKAEPELAALRTVGAIAKPIEHGTRRPRQTQ